MKLVTFRIDTPFGAVDRIGAVQGDSIVDLRAACEAFISASGSPELASQLAATYIPNGMVSFLAGGQTAMRMAKQSLDFTVAHPEVQGSTGRRWAFASSEARLLAPVPRPNTLRDFVSFETHAMHSRKDAPKDNIMFYRFPCFYKGNPGSVVGPEASIQWPSYTEKMDYELEFAIVIGKQGANIKAADADEYIAGFTIFNDFSARDVQRDEQMLSGMGPIKAKDFDTGNALGPWLVTPDEVGDPYALTMEARINGEVWSHGSTSTMYWHWNQIIERASLCETLYPGDVLGSGTVGRGCGMELDRWLQPNDVVELEVTKLGILRNRVAKS